MAEKFVDVDGIPNTQIIRYLRLPEVGNYPQKIACVYVSMQN